MNLGTLSHSFCFSFVPQNFLRFKYPPSLPLLRSDVVGGVLNIYLTHRFSVVLMSNQSLKSSGLVEWKKKIPLIAAAVRVAELPFRIFAATARDGHRKPMPGMWFELERIFAQDGITIG